MEPQNQNVRILVCTGGAWERVYGVLRYKPLALPRRILQLPSNVSYTDLMFSVARKLNLSLQTGFRMTYQFPLSTSNRNNKNVVVDLADDEDVEIFMDLALKTSPGLVTLYVVESVVGPRGDQDERVSPGDQGKNDGTHNFAYRNFFKERETTHVHVAGTSENRTNVLDSDNNYGEFNDFFDDQKGGNLNGAGGDTEGDISRMMSPSVSILAPNTTQENGADADGNADKEITLTLGAQRGLCKQEEKGDYVEVSGDTNPRVPAPDSNPRGVGGKERLFSSKEALKLTLQLKSVEEGFRIKATKSTKNWYEVRCVSEGCDWRISGTRIPGKNMFQVKNFEVPHRCSKPQGIHNHL